MLFKRSSDRQSNNHAADAGGAGSAYKSSKNTQSRPDEKPRILMVSALSERSKSYLSRDFDVENPDSYADVEMGQPVKSVSKPAPSPGIGVSLTDRLQSDLVTERPDKGGAETPRLEKQLLKEQLEISDQYTVLQKSRLYHSFFHEFDKALLLIKPDTLQITEANEAASRLLGRGANQLQDSYLRALVAQEFRPVLNTYIIRLLFEDLSTAELDLMIPGKGTKRVSIKGTVVKHNRGIIGILLQLS